MEPSVNPFVALLRCTSCRFTIFYALPFFAALAGAGQASVGWGMFSLAYWWLHSTGTEAANRLSDRHEDAINRPERTAMCAQLGWGRLRAALVAAWAGVAVLDVFLVVARPSVALAVLLVLSAASALGYSYGPRLARHRAVAPLLLTFHFGGTFITGWVVAHPQTDDTASGGFLREVGPFVVVSCATLLALGGSKDITDVSGDEAIGYRSGWIALVRRHGAWLTWALVMSTFALTAAFVVAGLLPERWLWIVVLLPLAVRLRQCLWTAATPLERAVTRELFYHYWIAYLCVAVLLYAPGPATALAVLVAALLWLIASNTLHWGTGVDRTFVRTVIRLGRRATRPPQLPDHRREGVA